MAVTGRYKLSGRKKRLGIPGIQAIRQQRINPVMSIQSDPNAAVTARSCLLKPSRRLSLRSEMTPLLRKMSKAKLSTAVRTGREGFKALSGRGGGVVTINIYSKINAEADSFNDKLQQFIS